MASSKEKEEITQKAEKVVNKPIDVFICSSDPNRAAMLNQVLESWNRKAGEFKIVQLHPDEDDKTGNSFQRDRRILAEQQAESDIYILSDDDCDPIGETFLTRGLKLMEAYPEFAILSAYPANPEINIYPWRPETDYSKEVYEDERVMEHVDVGGIRFTRKGVMSTDPEEWDKMDEPAFENNFKIAYDRKHCEQIRRKGYRVGYMRDVKMDHLGERERQDRK